MHGPTFLLSTSVNFVVERPAAQDSSSVVGGVLWSAAAGPVMTSTTDPSTIHPLDVACLRESLVKSEADSAAGPTFCEGQIRALHMRRSHTGSAEHDTACLPRSV